MSVKKIFIVTDNPGRLGNLMNRHGHLLAFAIENEFALVDYSFLDFARNFPRLNGNLLQGTPDVRVGVTPPLVLKLGFRLFRIIHRWKNLIGRMTRGFVGFVEAKYPAVADMESPEFLESVQSSRVVFISGYLFEAKGLFVKYAGAIRRQFEFPESIKRKGGAYIDGLREPGLEIVGVHIRHGDFREYCGGRWFYSAGQYAQVMRWMVANHPDRRFRFVVRSDEAQSPDAFAGLDVRIHASDYHADMQVLTLCDCIISTSSSFARAAAFLGNIPLLRIFDPDLPASHKFVTLEYLEEGWHWEGEMVRLFGDARGVAAKTAAV